MYIESKPILIIIFGFVLLFFLPNWITNYYFGDVFNIFDFSSLQTFTSISLLVQVSKLAGVGLIFYGLYQALHSGSQTLLLSIIVFVALLYYVVNPSILDTLKTQIHSIGSNTTSLLKINNNPCSIDQTQLKSYIETSYVFILENEGFSLCYGSDWKSYSTIFNTYSNLECKSGRTTGQNVNYEYCSRKYSFNPVLFCIKKTVLDSSGTVKDVIKKCVESYVRNPNANQVIDVKCVNPPQEISC